MNEIEKAFIPFDLARNLKNTLVTLFPNTPIEYINNENIFKLTCAITDQITIGIISCVEGYYQSVFKLNGKVLLHNDSHNDPWYVLKESINTGFRFRVESVCNTTSILE